MKSKIKIVSIVLSLSVSILLVSFSEQKTEWKGKIEYENGIKVIKNPQEALYGNIEFKLEEDLRIGREDDDNYMFYRNVRIAVDSDDNIFVVDGVNYRIQKFDRNGEEPYPKTGPVKNIVFWLSNCSANCRGVKSPSEL